MWWMRVYTPTMSSLLHTLTSTPSLNVLTPHLHSMSSLLHTLTPPHPQCPHPHSMSLLLHTLTPHPHSTSSLHTLTPAHPHSTPSQPSGVSEVPCAGQHAHEVRHQPLRLPGGQSSQTVCCVVPLIFLCIMIPHTQCTNTS